jgi:hypothetical protein
VGLSSVNLPNSVNTIEEAAFESCGIVSVHIPNSIINLGDRTFLSCENLESLTFDDDMQIDNISTYFVGRCSKLKHIEIPESVKAVGDGAFHYCSNLSSITCNPETVPTTGKDVFDGCPNSMKIYVPASSVDAYESASQWNNFAILPMGEGVISFDYEDGSAFELYPNPSEVNSQINLGDTFDRVEVYNAAGAKVAEYKETDNIYGIEISGIYFIKAVNDDKVRTCRIIVK